MADFEKRVRGTQFYIKALKTGETSASRQVASYMADGVIAVAGKTKYEGRDEVLFHITGAQPAGIVRALGGWSEPSIEADGNLVVLAEFPPFGAGANSATVTFKFDDHDDIREVTEDFVNDPPPALGKTIPLYVKGIIDGALANGTPITLAYVNERGEPEQALRGSVRVFGPTKLAVWLRNGEGGLAHSILHNPNLSLLYRDNRTRSTLTIKGVGHLEDDEAIKRAVWDMSPEVEQMHTPQRQGACLIIDIKEIRGSTQMGGVNIQS